MKLKEVFQSHTFSFMLQQSCDQPCFIAKDYGINTLKSFKYILFPAPLARQQTACYYCVPQKTSPLLCPLKIHLN